MNRSIGPFTTVENVRLEKFPEATLSSPRSMSELIDLIRAMSVGDLLFDSDIFFDVSRSGLRAVIAPVPHLSKGRKNSLHGVGFFQVSIESDRDLERPLPIAVKTFLPKNSFWNSKCPNQSADNFIGDPEESLVHELSAHHYLGTVSSHERGLLPIGVWKNKKKGVSLLTLFDEPIQTFDNVFWAKKKKAPTIKDEKIVYCLADSFFALGMVQGGGAAMLDAKVKNFGKDLRHTRFPDLEMLVLLEKTGERIVYTAKNKSYVHGDINMLLGSAVSTDEVSHTMYDRVGDLMMTPLVSRNTYRHYLAGIRQGERYTNLYLDNKLVITEENFVARTAYAIALEKEKRANASATN